MANRIVGLDISSRRVLAVEVEGAASRHPKLTAVHDVELPEGAARDSEVIEISAVSDALRQLWREAGFKSKRVVLGLGNQRVLVRDHTVPVMPLAQLRQSLAYQVADLLPVPVNETLLDFYPIAEVPGSQPPQMHGLLVAAIKESVETNVATVEDAGLSVAGVDLSPFAIVRALARASQLTGSRTVVVMGDRTTFIIVTADGVPQFVRIVPAGGESLTEAIETATGLDAEQAEELKYQVGIDQGANPEFREPSDAALRALKTLVGSVRSTNAYYQSSYDGEPINDLIVLGRDTRAPGLVRAVGEHAGLPATVGTPLAGLTIAADVDREKLEALEPDIATALGLALGSK